MAAVKLKTTVTIPSRVSPFADAIPEGAIFEAPQPWYHERRHSRVLERLTVDTYWEAVARGDALHRDPGEAPERYHSEKSVEEVAAESKPPEDGGEPSDSQKAGEARTQIEGNREDMLADLPDDPPDEDAQATLRILYALLKGEYQHRRSVLADVSERSARGSGDEIEQRLLAELYDREMSNGD